MINILPEAKSKVLYHNPDHNSWNKPYVLGRAGKAGGKNSTWFNVKGLTQDKHVSVDSSKIEGWKNIDEEVLVATQVNDMVEILEAKQVELTNWRKHNVYDETDDVGQRVISVRWVITQKFKNKVICKDHLVARGFKEDLNNIRKDSPTS